MYNKHCSRKAHDDVSAFIITCYDYILYNFYTPFLKTNKHFMYTTVHKMHFTYEEYFLFSPLFRNSHSTSKIRSDFSRKNLFFQPSTAQLFFLFWWARAHYFRLMLLTPRWITCCVFCETIEKEVINTGKRKRLLLLRAKPIR